MKNYYLSVLTRLTYTILACSVLWTMPAEAEELTKDCINCFSTELLSMEEHDNCITVRLEISGSNCIHALSHLTVQIPCGTITSASNTGGWPMELNSTDPTTGIYGIKVDNIQNFGERADSSQFILEYTICSDDPECITNIKSSSFEVAYKAATCVFIDTVDPEQPNLTAYLTTRDLLCYNEQNGQIITTITSGQEPYTFYWSNGSTSKDLNNIPAGSYELTIIDGNGKSLTLSAVINQPEAISVSASIQHANCGSADGAIDATINGGTAPYTYLWSNGDTTSSINQLTGGLYTLEINDANGCLKTQKYNISETTSLKASVTTDVIECHEEGKGTLEVTATGGYEPYTYYWDNGDTSSVANNLSSGPHKVIITDAAGCSIEKTAYVIINKLTASATTVDPVCNGEADGSAELSIKNGTGPYSVNWNTGDTATIISDLSAGWYWADITDTNGCTFRKYINIKEPKKITLTTSISRGSCEANDSTINIKVSANGGTSPYIYFRDDAETDPNITVDKTGYYTFRVVDTNGCENIDSILVTRPEAKLNSSINIIQPNCSNPDYGSATITISDGTAPYAIVWSDGSEALFRNDLTAGEYQVIITDANNCTSEHAINIRTITLASAEILEPEMMPECSSNNNMLLAFSNNSASYNWYISGSDAGWQIETPQADQLTYSAGQGDAWIQLITKSTDGCTAIDSIMLSCRNNDINNPTDSIIEQSDSCSLCYEIIPTGIWKIDEQCYKYAATVKTDGSCRYDLSHLTMQVNGGQVQFVTNTKGWKTELNSKDPTTGLYGFKIDDISNFGKSRDQFNIEYSICFTEESQRSFVVAYKSAQCVVTDTIYFSQQQFNTSLSSNSYPNPFNDAAQIEFTAKSTTNAELYIYDIYGNLVECLYKGSVDANTNYSFEFRPVNTQESLFFYRLICGDEVTQGKLMKVR